MLAKYWDDFKVGDRVVTQGVTITEAHLVNWAGLTMDYYPLHMDEEYAKKTQFGSRIAHGPLSFAIAIGLAYVVGFYRDSLIAWLGLENMRIPRPAKIGDTIRVELEVKERRETKKPDRGIGVITYTVKNQRDEVLMTFDCLQLMHRRTS